MDALAWPFHTPPLVGFGPTKPVGRRVVVLTSTGPGDWPADNSGVNGQ